MKDVEKTLAEFKKDLYILEPQQVFRKYIVDGECCIFENNIQMKLREEISNKYSLDYNSIIIVGSSKLGFSIKPKRRFQPFNDDSDIDIAIISKNLFEQIWERVHKYRNYNGNFQKSNEFYRNLSENGWIRPDLLPFDDYKNDWFEYFRKLTNSGNYGSYKISAGLYYNYFFLEQYQLICIKQCKESGNNDNSSN